MLVFTDNSVTSQFPARLFGFTRFTLLGNAFGDDALGHSQPVSAKFAFLVGFAESTVHLLVLAAGYVHRNADGKAACLSRRTQLVFAVLDEVDDHIDIGFVQTELAGDFLGLDFALSKLTHLAYEIRVRRRTA